jgi:hypothetical protein
VGHIKFAGARMVADARSISYQFTFPFWDSAPAHLAGERRALSFEVTMCAAPTRSIPQNKSEKNVGNKKNTRNKIKMIQIKSFSNKVCQKR